MRSLTIVWWLSLRFVRKGFVPCLFFCFILFTSSFSIVHSLYALDVTLAWDANTEPDLAGYELHYKTGSPGPPYNGHDSPIDVGNVTQFTIYGLDDDVTYFFVVTAYNADDVQSNYSNEVSTSDEETITITPSLKGAGTGGGCFIDTVMSTSIFTIHK